MDDDDQYEIERQANIKRNQELLQELGLPGQAQRRPRQSNGSATDTTSRTTRQKPKAQPVKRAQPERVQPRRTSNRIAGLEADSDTLKRRYEEEAEAAKVKYEAEKRARHGDHDLAFLLYGEQNDKDADEKATEKADVDRLATALRDVAGKAPTLTTDLIEDVKESKRSLTNGDFKSEHRELSEILDRMVLRSVDKAAQRRVYSMVFHPSADRDMAFIGDKEGNIGVWDPLALDDDAKDFDANDVGYGKSWSLQAHGKSPITCLRFDPIAADSLFSSSYDSSIRMQSLKSGVSTEVWTGQEDVLLSIFDILAPQSHPSAFTVTPAAGLDERSMWVADHRGGLNHFDLRQAGRRRGQQTTQRWQVCEKKIGGMAVNPAMSSCIAVASLDQHIRLFDVRALATLPTTNDAPYSARNVDADVLEKAEVYAQISKHRARLACTSVDFDARGEKLVGVSYDDVVKIWDVTPSTCQIKTAAKSANGTPKAARGGRKSGGVKKEDADEEEISPPSTTDILDKPIVIRHNNQTGKWLTLFRARFNGNPLLESHFSIGSMDRRAEIYAASDGQLLRTFFDDEHMTAVPAVTATHPRRAGRLMTGNASGKCTFWAPRD